MRFKPALLLHLFIALFSTSVLTSAFAGETYVDFKKEVWPVLQQNCIACHNTTKFKGDFNMESLETMMKGGESGPALVKGHAEQSNMFKLAAGEGDEVMPPAKNNVGARRLTKPEVDTLKKWIDQGARGFAPEEVALPLVWRALPPDWQAIHAVAVTRDGQYAFAARSNQIYAYQLPTTSPIAPLGDPKLPPGPDGAPTADRDIVESLAVSPDGERVAAGGYRSIKIFKRTAPGVRKTLETGKVLACDASPDGKLLAVALEGNKIALWDVEKAAFAREFAGSEGLVKSLQFSVDGAKLVSGGADKKIRVWNVADGKQLHSLDTPAEISAVCWTPAVKGFAAAGADNIVRVFAGENDAFKPYKEIKVGGAVTCFSVSLPEGRHVLAGCADNCARVLDISDGKETRKLDHGAPVSAVAMLSVGSARYAAAGGNMVRIWKQDANLTATIKGDRRANEAQVELEQRVAYLKSEITYYKAQVTEGEKQLGLDTESLKKATEAQPAAVKDLAAKKTAFEKAQADKKASDETSAKPIEAAKKALETKDAAEKAVADLDKAAKPLRDPAAKAREAANKSAAAMKELTDKAASRETKVKELEAAFKTAKDAANKATATQKTLTDAVAAADKSFKDAETKLKAAKDAAAKTPENKELAAPVAAAEAAFKDCEGKLKSARDAAEKGAPAVKPATDALAAADAALKEQQGKLKASREAVDAAAPGNRDLADKATAAETALAAAEKSLATATTARDAAVKANTELAAKGKEADDKKKAADKAFTDAQNALNAADMAQTVADQNLERCTATKKRVEDTLAANKAGLASTEEGLKKSEIDFEAAKKRTTEREKNFVTLALSADKKMLAAAMEDGTLHTFNADSGKGAEVLEGVPAQRLSFLPDGRLIAIGDKAALCQVTAQWALERAIGTGDEKSPLNDRILALEFSPDSKVLASGGGIPSRSGEVKLWDAATGSMIREFPDVHTDTVFCLSYSRDGKFLATGSADKLIRVLDPHAGKQVRHFEGHTGHVTGIAWKQNGRTIVSGGADRGVKVWDLITGEQTKTFQEVKKPVTAVRFLDAQNEVLFTAGDGQIRTVRDTGDRVRSYSGKGEYVQAAACTADGKVVLTGGSLGALCIFNGLDGKLITSFDAPALKVAAETKK